MKKSSNAHDLRVQSIALALLFFFLAGSVAFFHEPWRDEAQSWLLARDTSLIELFGLAKYEGSFILWHVLIMPFAKLGFPYEIQSLLALGIGTATAYLVARFAPFSLVQKILLLGGYYFFYEYTVIARSYGLTIFFAVLMVVLYHARTVRYGASTLVRILLSMTNIFGVVFSVIFSFAGWFIDSRLRNTEKRKVLLYETFFLAALLAQALVLTPPPDLASGLTKHLFSSTIHLLTTLQALNGAFTKIFPSFFTLGLFAFFAIVFWGFVSHRARSFFLVLSFVLLITIERLDLQSVRHLGMLFIGYALAYWMHAAEKPPVRVSFFSRAPSFLFTFLLVIQILAAIPAIAYEIAFPFSSGRAAARAIQALDAYDPQGVIISADSALTESIRPYLPRQFYCLEYEQMCSYVVWNTQYESWSTRFRADGWTDDALARLERTLALTSTSPYRILVSPFPLPAHAQTKWTLLLFVPAGLVHDELFYLYEYRETEAYQRGSFRSNTSSSANSWGSGSRSL